MGSGAPSYNRGGKRVNPATRAASGGAPPPSFLPSDIPDLVLWSDANDLATITMDGSNKVSAWNDKSGNGRNWTQSTAVNQPTYTANALNGGTMPGLLCDKTAPSFMSLASGLALTAYTVYMVFRPTETKRHFLLSNNSGSAIGIMALYGDLDLLQDNNDTSFFNGTGASPANEDHSWLSTCPGAANTGAHYRDFVALASGGSSGAGSMGMTLNQFGRRSNGGFGATWEAQGYIAEFCIWSRVIDATERGQMATYSAGKWGV